MFHDLNIALPEAAGKPNGHLSSHEWAQVAQTVEQARAFGYSVVALNQTVHGKLMPEHLAIWKAAPTFNDADLGWDMKSGARVGTGMTGRVRRGRIRVLRRLTQVVADSAQGLGVLSSSNSTVGEYDVVAVQPTSEKALATACSGAWDAVDIVSLDMGRRWGFHAKLKTVGQALAQGLTMEIAYRPALTDSQTRQQWVCNASGMVRSTRGKGMIWTSGARQALDLRAPYDIANLGEALQLNGDLSKRALSSNAHATLMHAFTRRDTLRAVVSARPGLASDSPEPAAKKAKRTP
ncbi:RNA-binding RNA processing protein rpp1 [Coemansia sp. RSA 552]|nr:RNA-binding RNA processing protein rpp1 [Coemansia sp. RSA 552]